MTLPETALQTDHDVEHITHHANAHTAANQLLGGSLRGDQLAVSTVDQPGVNRLQRRSTNEYTNNQVTNITHTTPGIVTLPVAATTRLVIVDASANITGWDAAGADSHGAMCRLRVIVRASTSIVCSTTFGRAETINPPDGSMTVGSIWSFQWVSFGTGGTMTSVTSGLEGFGTSVTGGANYQVVEFTNLNDAGAGSFREALTGGGNRIIKPAAGLTGDINLLTRLEVQQHDNVTIDMDKRIRVLGRWIRWQDCDNVLVTRTKFGPVDDGGQGDSMSYESLSGATRDLHFATTYCEFEGPNSDAALDIVWNYGNDVYSTIAHCLFYQHGKTFLIDADSGSPWEGGTYYTTLYRNWFYDCTDRQPFSQNANTHVFNSVIERYGEAGGGGGAIKTRGLGDTLVEYCVGLPRDIGETVGYDGSIVTNAHDAFSEPNWTSTDVSTHRNIGNILLPSNDGQSNANQIDSDDAATVFTPPYPYTVDTTPDPEEIRLGAGVGTDPRPGSAPTTNTGGNTISGRTVAAGGGGSANNTADLYASNGAGGFGAWLAYTLTDANGDWSYPDLDDGDYFIRVIAAGGGTWAETSAGTWDSAEIILSGNTAADQGILNRAT